uniref:SFRICE_029269 n=1 Tax=Spodoptera frugiperda TaxID=7108 RepID=A0A2H1WPR2_SPOFR
MNTDESKMHNRVNEQMDHKLSAPSVDTGITRNVASARNLRVVRESGIGKIRPAITSLTLQNTMQVFFYVGFLIVRGIIPVEPAHLNRIMVPPDLDKDGTASVIIIRRDVTITISTAAISTEGTRTMALPFESYHSK